MLVELVNFDLRIAFLGMVERGNTYKGWHQIFKLRFLQWIQIQSGYLRLKRGSKVP